MQHKPKALVDWQPGCPIPFEDCECDPDSAPEGLSVEDVRLIWWVVASSFDSEQLQEKLQPVVDAHKDWGCFHFLPIAELSGRSAYPYPVFQLLLKLLPAGALFAVDDEESRGADTYNMLIVQADIWHELTWKALDLCCPETLTADLRELRLIRDLGL